MAFSSAFCHLEPKPSLERGDMISTGAAIGVVAAPGRRLNDGIGHVHIALNTDPSYGTDRSDSAAVPFSDMNALSDISFPAGMGYTGIELLSLLPVATAPGAPALTPTPAAVSYPAQSIRPGANAIAYFGPPASPREAFAGIAGYRATYEWDAVTGRWRFDILGVEAGDLLEVRPSRTSPGWMGTVRSAQGPPPEAVLC